MSKRKPMLTYLNAQTRRNEHIALDRVVGFAVALNGDTIVKIDYGDGVERIAYSRDSKSALESRLARLKEANGIVDG